MSAQQKKIVGIGLALIVVTLLFPWAEHTYGDTKQVLYTPPPSQFRFPNTPDPEPRYVTDYSDQTQVTHPTPIFFAETRKINWTYTAVQAVAIAFATAAALFLVPDAKPKE